MKHHCTNIWNTTSKNKTQNEQKANKKTINVLAQTNLCLKKKLTINVLAQTNSGFNKTKWQLLKKLYLWLFQRHSKETKFIRSHEKDWLTVWDTAFRLKEDQTGTNQKGMKFPAVGKACKAIFCPPGLMWESVTAPSSLLRGFTFPHLWCPTEGTYLRNIHH